MNKFSSAIIRRNTIVNSIVCSLLFIFFSFTYLYLVQGEAINHVHAVLSEGKTHYSLFWGALIISIILWIISWGLNLVTQFRGKWTSVSYFPAFIVIIILSSFYPSLNKETFTLALCDEWWWCIPAIIMYVTLAILYQRIKPKENILKLPELMIPNISILIVFIYLTGTIGNNNELFHNELYISSAIQNKDYKKAAQIGIKSPHNSQTLTALRALALSCTDSLGQCLFFYTQNNGADGLFMDESIGKRSIITNDSIYKHLGAIDRKSNEPAINYLQRICEDETASSYALDYYLCALLLERQLTTFKQALETFYDEDKSLPRHYQEALILLQDKEGKDSNSTQIKDSLIINKYDDFKALQQSYKEEQLKNNYTRRKFGDTYWWYFWYGN